MWSYKINQHLLVLNLLSASINGGLATEFMIVKVHQKLNLMWVMSTLRNQQPSSYVFSKELECLEQNVRK